MSGKKVAIVTGGASRIALAIAEKFVRQNVFSIVIGSDKQKLVFTKEKMGASCEPNVCDLVNLSTILKLENDDMKRKGMTLERTLTGKFDGPSDIGDAGLFPASDAANYFTCIASRVKGGNSTVF